MSDTPRDDDRPLSSEEMIRLAREDLTRQPGSPERMMRDREAIEEMAEAELPSIEELTATTSPRRRPRRTQDWSATPTGHGDAAPPARLALVLGVAVALIGIAILAFVAFATTTP